MGKSKKVVDPLLEGDQEEKELGKTEGDEVKTEAPKVEPKKTEKIAMPKVPAKPMTMDDVLDSAAKTKAILAAGPHSMFLIPLAAGEKVGAYETVELNGYKLTIKKGCMVNLPVPIIEILANHYNIEITAGQNMLIDRDDRVQNALS